MSVFRLALFLMVVPASAVAQGPLTLLPVSEGNRWSYDVAAGDTTVFDAQSDWIWESATTDAAGVLVTTLLVVTRGDGEPTIVRPCALFELYDETSSRQSLHLVRSIYESDCWANAGLPFSFSAGALYARPEEAIEEEVSVSGDMVSAQIVRGEYDYSYVAGPRPGIDPTYEYRVSSTLADGLGPVESLYRFGIVPEDPGAEYVKMRLVGARIDGEAVGTVRTREPDDPEDVFGLSVGSVWQYRVEGWSDRRDEGPVSSSVERWEIVEALGEGAYRLAVTGETGGECVVTTRTVGQVAVLSASGRPCPLAQELYAYTALGYDPESNRDRLLSVEATTDLFSAPSVEGVLQVRDDEVRVPLSSGVFVGRVRPRMESSEQITTTYDIARGVGVARLTSRGFVGATAPGGRRDTTTERTLIYASVGGAVYGGEPVATASRPDQATVRLRVGPNPTHGHATLWVEGSGAGEVTVFDVLGREVRRHAEVRPGAVRLDLSGLPAGAYTVRFSDGASVSTARLLVVR